MPPKGFERLEMVIDKTVKRSDQKWENRLNKKMEKLKAKENNSDSEEEEE